MKKMLILLLSCSIILNFYTVNASTDVKNNEKFYAEEIHDTEILRSRAENGITDFSFEKDTVLQISMEEEELSKEQLKLNMGNIEDSASIELKDSLYTVQKLKTVQEESGTEVADYVAHIFVDVNIESERTFTRGVGSGSEDDDDGDTVTGATLEMIAYFTYSKDGMDDPYFCFTNVKAKYIRYDSTIQATNLKVNNNKTGLIYNDMYGNSYYGSTDFDMITVSSPISGKWYNNYNSRYVLLTGTAPTDGVATASSELKLKRGTRTWYLECLIVKEYI